MRDSLYARYVGAPAACGLRTPEIAQAHKQVGRGGWCDEVGGERERERPETASIARRPFLISTSCLRANLSPLPVLEFVVCRG